jgi:hypothetical protein
MVTSRANTVREYLAGLPADRRAAIAAVRKVIRDHLPDGYEEGMLYGMISYYVPLSRYPTTYNGQPLALASLASQKGHMSLYLMCVYGNRELERWFAAAFRKAGKKLDMGKSCVRFESIDDLPLDVIGETIARTSIDDYIASYERRRGAAAKPHSKRTRAAKRAAAERAPAERAPARRAPAKTSRPKARRARSSATRTARG